MSAKRKPGVQDQSPGHKPGDRGPAEKTGRSIRRPARIRSLHQARSGFRANGTSGRAPALHAKEYLTTPAFEYLSLPFHPCEADAAALVGRVRNALHSATDLYSMVHIICKVSFVNTVNRKMWRRRLSRWRSGAALESYAWRPRPSAGQTAGIDPELPFLVGSPYGRNAQIPVVRLRVDRGVSRALAYQAGALAPPTIGTVTR